VYSFFVGTLLLPVTPTKLKVRISNKNQVLELANGRDINMLKAPGLTEIKVKVLLPMFEGYPFARYQAGFRKPTYFLERFASIKTREQPVTFACVREMSGRKIDLPTSMSVGLEDYDIIEDSEANGMDMLVELSFRQHPPYGTKSIVVDVGTGIATTETPREVDTAPDDPTYTIQSGDTLPAIAARKLGDSNRGPDIFRHNEAVIEQAARDRGRASSSNGWWIFPGTVIRIPPR